MTLEQMKKTIQCKKCKHGGLNAFTSVFCYHKKNPLKTENGFTSIKNAFSKVGDCYCDYFEEPLSSSCTSFSVPLNAKQSLKKVKK